MRRIAVLIPSSTSTIPELTKAGGNNIIAMNQGPRALDEELKQLHGRGREMQTATVAAQLMTVQVKPEGAELINRGRNFRLRRGGRRWLRSAPGMSFSFRESPVIDSCAKSGAETVGWSFAYASDSE